MATNAYGQSATSSAANPAVLVGHAFRCSDGLVRWITHLSTRNYYSVLWRYETDDVWHSGGIVKADKWENGEEVAAPQPGETYRQAGATGVISERFIAKAVLEAEQKK